MNRAADILVCFAVSEEAAEFKKISTDLAHVRIATTGMGIRNAQRAIRNILSEHIPDIVISSGFAGGLNPRLRSGTIVFDAGENASIHSELLRCGAEPAQFHCAERVVVTAAEKRALRDLTGADAVDMESAAIGVVCRERRIPVATIRVILDTADADLPLDFNALMTRDSRMNYRRLLLQLLGSPGSIAGLVRLGKQSRAAAKRLADVLYAAVTKDQATPAPVA